MITKTAETSNHILEPIRERWSPRAFADRPVDPDVLRRLFEAARWAMSSFNEQPWRFIVGVKGQPGYDGVFACLNDWNQKWAGTAPVIVLVAGRTRFSLDESENRVWLYDCGAAAGFLCLQATQEGLHTHQMAGILPEKAHDSLDVPEGFEVVTAIAIGHQGEVDRIPDDYHDDERAPRDRKPLDEIVFHGRWGKTS
mgnify:CR=1 FL=1